MEFVCGYSGSCFHKVDFESGVHEEWMTKEKLSGTDKAAEMECYKQRWVGAILISALVAESRNCRHGFFSSSGTGCGIRGIAWAGLHDDAPEKGLTLSASCCGRTVSCPAHPCGGRKFFQIIPWVERRSGAQALDPRPRFQIRFRHFFCPVEQGSHGFGNAHVQPVADPGIRYQQIGRASCRERVLRLV